MCCVSTQGTDEHMINVHYYYYYTRLSGAAVSGVPFIENNLHAQKFDSRLGTV